MGRVVGCAQKAEEEEEGKIPSLPLTPLVSASADIFFL